MLDHWDSRRTYSVSLKTRELSDRTPFVRFEYMKEPNAFDFSAELNPEDFPLGIETETYNAEVKTICTSDSRGVRKLRIALDRESQDLVDLFIDIERNEKISREEGLRRRINDLIKENKKLRNKIGNFITWKNVKTYLVRRFL